MGSGKIPMIEFFSTLKAIEDLSLESINQEIAWLEEALLAMKTLRAVKEVTARRPSNPTWISAVDMDREEEEIEPPQFIKEVHQRKLKTSERVEALLDEHPEGLTAKEVSNLMNISLNSVHSVLNNGMFNFHCVGERNTQGRNARVWASNKNVVTARYAVMNGETNGQS